MTLDYENQGLNETFTFQNPNEEASCGCGVSITFNEDIISKSKR
jgi:Fe-S cluster assembly iron-binding protein IscA